MRWRFIDRVTRFEPWAAIAGVKAVSLEEYSLLEPLGRTGRFPETIVIEAGVQLARWLVAASSAFEQSCVLEAVEAFEFKGEAGAGSSLNVSLAVTQRNGDGLRVDVSVLDGGRPVGGGTLGVCFLPMREMAAPEDMRTLWQELYAKTSGA